MLSSSVQVTGFTWQYPWRQLAGESWEFKWVVERGCLFWIFNKQIPGQPVLQSFLMATLPPEPGGGGRAEERGETSVGNLGSQAKQRGVLAHLLFVLFDFVFFSPFSSWLLAWEGEADVLGHL